jgi:hypothetical protein
VDPYGLYLGPWHGAITFVAMLVSGYDPVTAAFAAGANIGSDFTPHSQKPENANQHGMATPDQNVEQAKEGARDYINKQLSKGGLISLGAALHDTEDQFAGGHKYKTWDGKITLKHIFYDVIPFGAYDAFMADLKLLKRYRNRGGSAGGCPP